MKLLFVCMASNADEKWDLHNKYNIAKQNAILKKGCFENNVY